MLPGLSMYQNWQESHTLRPSRLYIMDVSIFPHHTKRAHPIQLNYLRSSVNSRQSVLNPVVYGENTTNDRKLLGKIVWLPLACSFWSKDTSIHQWGHLWNLGCQNDILERSKGVPERCHYAIWAEALQVECKMLHQTGNQPPGVNVSAAPPHAHTYPGILEAAQTQKQMHLTRLDFLRETFPSNKCLVSQDERCCTSLWLTDKCTVGTGRKCWMEAGSELSADLGALSWGALLIQSGAGEGGTQRGMRSRVKVESY